MLLARYRYIALSLHLTVTSQYCVEIAKWIGFDFGAEATIGLLIVLKGNLDVCSNKGTSLSKIAPNSGI